MLYLHEIFIFRAHQISQKYMGEYKYPFVGDRMRKKIFFFIIKNGNRISVIYVDAYSLFTSEFNQHDTEFCSKLAYLHLRNREYIESLNTGQTAKDKKKEL